MGSNFAPLVVKLTLYCSEFVSGEYLKYEIAMIVEYSLTLDTFINLDKVYRFNATFNSISVRSDQFYWWRKPDYTEIKPPTFNKSRT